MMLDNLQSMIPIIVLSFGVVVVLVVSAFRSSSLLNSTLAVGALGCAAVFICGWDQPVLLFSNTLKLDAFARIGALACVCAGIIACLPAASYLKRTRIALHDEYFALVLASVTGMVVMMAANDLMVMFVNLEIMSIAMYILCGINRFSTKSTESALKYFINGAVSSAILLFGIAMLYGVFGTTNLDAIASQASSAHGSLLALFGAACLLVGFLFKLGVFPFHMWVPDVYQGAPTLVTGLMAAGIRIAAGVVLIRLFADVFAPLAPGWDRMLWWIAAITMTIGNFSALVQNNVKRMLGYSSIAHAGYLMVAFVGLTSANFSGAEAAVYYLIAYSVASLGMLVVVGQIEGERETFLEYDDYKGLGLRHPWAGVALSIFLLSLTGIPPLAGFFGKLSLFSTAIKNGYTGLAVIGVLNSLVSAYFYFRLMVNMYMHKSAEVKPAAFIRTPMAFVTILTCCFLTLWFGFGPFQIFGAIPSVDTLVNEIASAIGAVQSRL